MLRRTISGFGLLSENVKITSAKLDKVAELDGTLFEKSLVNWRAGEEVVYRWRKQSGKRLGNEDFVSVGGWGRGYICGAIQLPKLNSSPEAERTSGEEAALVICLELY